MLKYKLRSEVDTDCSCNGHHDAFLLLPNVLWLWKLLRMGTLPTCFICIGPEPGQRKELGPGLGWNFSLLANSVPVSMLIHVQEGPYVLISVKNVFCYSWVSAVVISRRCCTVCYWTGLTTWARRQRLSITLDQDQRECVIVYPPLLFIQQILRSAVF